MSHSGDNLKKLVLNAVTKYGSKLENIYLYTVTTDNSSNFVKAINLMSNSVENDSENEILTSDFIEECDDIQHRSNEM